MGRATNLPEPKFCQNPDCPNGVYGRPAVLTRKVFKGKTAKVERWWAFKRRLHCDRKCYWADPATYEQMFGEEMNQRRSRTLQSLLLEPERRLARIVSLEQARQSPNFHKRPSASRRMQERWERGMINGHWINRAKLEGLPPGLTDEQVTSILADPRPYQVVAEEHHCSSTLINDIKHGRARAYQHVPRTNVVLRSPGPGIRQVKTPLGIFPDLHAATKKYGIGYSTGSKLAHSNKDGWSYVE